MSAFREDAPRGGGGGGASPTGRSRKGTTNSLVTPLLTDMYQISMTYAHWKGGRVDDHAVFDLFFRKNPFKGEFCIFCGLDEVLRHLESFHISEDDILYLKTLLPHCEPEFFRWLGTQNCSKVKIYSMEEGSVSLCFNKTVYS